MKKLSIALCLVLLALSAPAAWASDAVPTTIEPATESLVEKATESLVEELEAEAGLEFLVAEFPLNQALQQMSHSCTPDPCADCAAERLCCLGTCAAGDFDCVIDCYWDYRVCAFTCPNG